MRTGKDLLVRIAAMFTRTIERGNQVRKEKSVYENEIEIEIEIEYGYGYVNEYG